MGIADRTIRLLVAAIIGVLAFAGVITGTWEIVLLVITGVFVLTSLVGFCPLYAIFGLNTCPRTTKHHN
ncbi:YgaP family membrane protein [Pontibacter sp. H249]|uniref:YgaP family membrane protein n=1 Tax=Pontibacter sp. H249 TaxID=3133420 RepID=UPI0030BDC928